jgi:hypothetical protein
MPNKAKTPMRTVRIPDDQWQAALAGAAAEGTNVSAVIQEFLAKRFPVQ